MFRIVRRVNPRFLFLILLLVGLTASVYLVKQEQDRRSRAAGSFYDTFFPVGSFDASIPGPNELTAYINDTQPRGMDSLMMNNNNVTNPLQQQMLTVADQKGLNYIIGPQNELYSQWWNNDTAPQTIEKAREIAAPLVALMKDHPSLKGYNLLDDAWGEPIQKRNLMQQAFYELDPARPVSYIGGQDTDRYDFITNRQPRAVYLYSYPAGTGSAACQFNRGDSGQRDWVDNFRIERQFIPDNTPIWQILQTHQTEKNINGVILDPDSTTSLRYPTVEELRLQQWLAVGEGVRGIFWFTYSDQNDTNPEHFAWKGWKSNPAFQTEITDLSKRLIPLKPVLVASEKIDDKFTVVGSGKTYSSTFLNKTSNALYVLVVNADCTSKTVTLSSKYLTGQLKNVEDSSVSALNAQITLRGGDGKLFEIVNKTLITPQPTPGARINVVQNGGFETLDSTGKPLNWTAIASYIDKTVSRSGTNSLKVIGPTTEIYFWNRPTLKPNTKYMLTAWVKSENATSVGADYIVENPGFPGAFASARSNGTHAFRKVYSLFTTPATFVDGRLDIRFTLPSGGTAWVDDVEVCEVSESCSPIPYTLLQSSPITTPTPATTTIQSPVNGVSYQNKPWNSSELTSFMKSLADKVTTRHGKKNLTNIPALKGFVYEYMEFNPDTAIEGTRLDSMHDGAWLGNALTSAYRSSRDTHFLSLLNNYSLTFYPNTLNNSDKYFVLDILDSQARVATVASIPKPADYPSNPVSKGVVPYWWDDGESLSLEAGDGKPLIGYKGTKHTSLHMEDDISMMLGNAYQLTKSPDVKLAIKNLALANPIAFGNEGGGQPSVHTRYIALKINPGDSTLSKFGSLPTVSAPPIFNNPSVAPFSRGSFFTALYGNTTQLTYSNLDGQQWDYYWSLLDQDRQPLTDATAKNYMYLAYTNIVWNQLWFGNTPRQPGLDRFDISSQPRSNEKFELYYEDDLNAIQGVRLSGMNMFFSAVSLQMLGSFPNAWTRWRDEAFPSDTDVEILWNKPTMDGQLDSSGYSPPITIDTNTTLRLRSGIDTLYILIDRPQGQVTEISLFARPDAAAPGAVLNIDGAGNIQAKGKNGTDDLITTKAIVTANGKNSIEIALPYTIVKTQKPWANAIDDSRLSLKGRNGLLHNLYFLSSPATVRTILEKEMVEGFRFWEFVNADWGMIPSGFYLARGKMGIWQGFSDSGNYAHLINAAAAYQEYLNGQKNWELFSSVTVSPTTPTVTQVATLTPTISPTPTRTPTPIVPTNTPAPTSTPAPTATPVPNSTKFSLNILLHGIGKGGDNANPNGTGNISPLHPQRIITLELFDAANTLVKTVSGTITFSSTNGNFTGVIDGGIGISSGSYLVKVKTSPYLRRQLGGIVTIIANQTVTLPQGVLIVGDANNDNNLNILDYNLMLDCYSELLPPRNCTASKLLSTDFNDDGAVNQFDYNLFLRELSIQVGQ